MVKRLWFAFAIAIALFDTASAAARRIVTLAPNLTELAYAAGAGELLVGAVMYSDYPEAARRLPRVGDAFRVDNERLLALQPDLVLAWTSGTPQVVIENLRDLGLNVVEVEVSQLAQVGSALRRLGKLAGTEATAERAAQEFEKQMAALREEHASRRRLRVFVEVDRQPLFTVNRRHVISEVVELCGGDNVFTDLKQLAPPISVEAVIAADPEVILGSFNDAGSLREDWRPWRNISAVRNGQLYIVNPDTLTRATPRLVEGAREVCHVLEKVRQRTH